MTSFVNDPEQWYEAYEPASKKQRYEIVLETIQQPLPLKLVEEADLGMCLVETKSDLEANNLIPELLEFIETLQTQQPEFYRKEFFYYDDFLVTYYLFQNAPEKVAESCVRFIEEPISSIDEFLTILEKLRYYGYTELAEQISRKCYKRVAKAPSLLRGTEWDFANIIFDNLVQQTYLRLQREEEVNWQAFHQDALKYGFDNEQEWVDELRDALTTGVASGGQFVEAFKTSHAVRENLLNGLNWEFCCYMLNRKQMDFMCSEKLWNNLLVFWCERDDAVAQSPSSDVFFYISEPVLDEYLAQMAGGFMSSRQSTSIAILWSIPYVYDFLLFKEIISPSLHDEVLQHVAALKPEAVRAFQNHLWEYDFVHRWARPDSVPEAAFTAEAEMFAASINNVKPLRETPYDPGNQLREMFGGLE
jgi:hypothetical protein